jgi:hypothetical protein
MRRIASLSAVSWIEITDLVLSAILDGPLEELPEMHIDVEMYTDGLVCNGLRD